jgi:hypothetical protein
LDRRGGEIEGESRGTRSTEGREEEIKGEQAVKKKRYKMKEKGKLWKENKNMFMA